MAKHFEESLKRVSRLEGIVERIMNGSRFKIRLLSESAVISFALAGVRCPSTSYRAQNKKPVEGEEFGEEATQYSRLHFLQRPVELKVETCDRGGNFIGVAWCGKECINVQLVAQGLAEVHDRGAAAIRKELEEAQSIAAEKCLGLWSVKRLEDSCVEFDGYKSGDGLSNEAELELQENGAKPVQNVKIFPSVAVVHSSDVNDLFIQCSPCPEVDALQEQLNSYVEVHRKTLALPSNNSIKQGDVVLGQFSEDKQVHKSL